MSSFFADLLEQVPDAVPGALADAVECKHLANTAPLRVQHASVVDERVSAKSQKHFRDFLARCAAHKAAA